MGLWTTFWQSWAVMWSRSSPFLAGAEAAILTSWSWAKIERLHNTGAGPKLKGSTTLELGTRQHGRVNVTLFSGLKGVGYCNITKVVVVSPFRHKDITGIIFQIFSWPEISIMFLRCRCRKVKKCRVPGSVLLFDHWWRQLMNMIFLLWYPGAFSA